MLGTELPREGWAHRLLSSTALPDPDALSQCRSKEPQMRHNSAQAIDSASQFELNGVICVAGLRLAWSVTLAKYTCARSCLVGCIRF